VIQITPAKAFGENTLKNTATKNLNQSNQKMELKELKNYLYEENHSPFYVKYYALSNNQLQELMQRCDLIKEDLFIKFTDKYIYFDKEQGREIIKNTKNFSKIGLLRELTKEHLGKIEGLTNFCKNLNLPEEQKNLTEIFSNYLNLYSTIPAYDLLIHLIWSIKANEVIKESKLSPMKFFELTCPPKTIVSSTYLDLLKLVEGGRQNEITTKYGWVPNLKIYTGMTKIQALKRRKETLKKLEYKTKKHSSLGGSTKTILFSIKI